MTAIEVLPPIAELERRLLAVEPAAFLVPDRILRRVIKNHRRLPGLGLQVPHGKSYVIDRSALLDLVDRDELGGEPSRDVPETVILIRRPDAEDVAARGFEAVLLYAWRLLFHGRVHQALEQQLALGKLSEAGIRRRLERLGQTECEEIKHVLRQENFLLPPRDRATIYVEFAALYLELRFFAPALIGRYFPALIDTDSTDAFLAEDIDAAGLFAATRPQGAPDALAPLPRNPTSFEIDDQGSRTDGGHASADEFGKRMAHADQVGSQGNVVRAAILRTLAASASPQDRAETAVAGARADIDRLARRLQIALLLPDDQTEQWRRLLPALLPRAARGFWTVEARLLYDLQKVCLDQEHEIYAVDLMEWALSLGRRPVKRPLPGHREVLMVKHLQNAGRRLLAVRLTDRDRQGLSALLAAAVQRSESRLRDHFRPALAAALTEVGLVPANMPEEVARHKLTEELLDQVCERGYLTMSDLRDALSRNQLKLPDLAGPAEFLLGDKLIRLNRCLAVGLDGVYHRGEIYRRWLQRLSSVAFGTRPGRFLTRYLALPFGGAFVALEGLGHLCGLINQYLLGSGEKHVHLATPWSVGILGLFLLALIYVAGFRRTLVQGFRLAGRVLWAVLIDAPSWVLRLPPVRLILDSPPLQWFGRVLFKPFLLALLAAGIALICGSEPVTGTAIGTGIFLTAAFLFNSRWGRNAEEALADWLVRSWKNISINLVPGLIRLVLDFFKHIVDAVEKLLYTVDEWFRFKSGESKLMLPVKAGLGLVWFFVNYIVRFCINLLIEPQINPIKHFPVVTVSHKLLVAFVFPLRNFLIDNMDMDRGMAGTVATIVITSIPGIFGFLVWELKENWRLYQANRSPVLGPVVVGSHGETMVRLLTPGFHSGTIPKLYAKLRRAERRGKRRTVRRHQEALHHVQERVGHFVDREFLELLRRSKAWDHLPLAVAKVRLATNRIRIDLRCADWPDDSLTIMVDQQSGWLVARLMKPAWVGKLSEAQRQVLAAALTGLYKLAGVDLIAEQIRTALEPCGLSFAVATEGLVVWPVDRFENEVVYHFQDGQVLPARANGTGSALPALTESGVFFRNLPIPWRQWVDSWEEDRAGKGPARLVPVI